MAHHSFLNNIKTTPLYLYWKFSKRYARNKQCCCDSFKNLLKLGFTCPIARTQYLLIKYATAKHIFIVDVSKYKHIDQYSNDFYTLINVAMAMHILVKMENSYYTLINVAMAIHILINMEKSNFTLIVFGNDQEHIDQYDKEQLHIDQCCNEQINIYWSIW